MPVNNLDGRFGSVEKSLRSLSQISGLYSEHANSMDVDSSKTVE